MILVDIEIFSEIEKEYKLFEAIVDTGSTYCVIEKQIADKLGLEYGEVLHLWQMGSALIVPKTKMKARYKEKKYEIEGLIIEIKESYKQSMIKEELCTRPESPHPLTNRIVIGKSLLDKLPKEEYSELFKIAQP